MTVPERPVLVAPDSFKGTFRAAEVAAAIGRGLERAGLLPPDLCPLADGGEGTMEALLLALGGETVAADVHDPLGRPLRAPFGLVEDGGTAVLEMAAASGLGLVSEDGARRLGGVDLRHRRADLRRRRRRRPGDPRRGRRLGHDGRRSRRTRGDRGARRPGRARSSSS